MKSKSLLLFLVSAIFASGCAPARPKALPHVYYDLGNDGKAYIEDRTYQKRSCERTWVLGFELGESTYVEVKAKLPRGANPRDQYYGTYGPFFITDGAGYGIAEFESVAFSFDRRWKLASVNMSFSECAFSAYKKRIASQYRLYADLSGGTAVYQASPDDGAFGYYFGDYIVVSETYNEHYRRTFFSVSFTTTLPFDLKRKVKAETGKAPLF